MRTLVFLFFLVTTLAGCAMAPPIPQFETKRGDRVGIYVDIGEGPTHTHIGTTIFNNFSKRYPYAWNLETILADSLKTSLNQAGISVVDLKAEGFRYSDLAGLIEPGEKQWVWAPGTESTKNRLRNEKNLKAVIVVKENRVLAALECGGGPCNERYADSPGLYTRSMLVLTVYNAVAAYSWDVYLLDPTANLAYLDSIHSKMRIPSVRLTGYDSPADFKNLSEAEFKPVRDALVKFSDSLVDETVRALKPKD